jgi:protein-S-isoprenylcysteine O-methyltransferase Ste14
MRKIVVLVLLILAALFGFVLRGWRKNDWLERFGSELVSFVAGAIVGVCLHWYIVESSHWSIKNESGRRVVWVPGHYELSDQR